MNSDQVFKLLTDTHNQLENLKDTKRDKFCSYDAESDKCIVEIKARRKWYDGSTQIEKQKYDKNIVDGRPFLYAVYDGVGFVHIWNVSKLAEQGYDFNWHIRKCPATTDFSRRQYVDKEVGELRWEDALMKIKV